MIFPNPIRVSGTQAFCGCRFCHGNGCLACQAEADRAYKAEFPDGPKPIAEVSHAARGKRNEKPESDAGGVGLH